MDEISLRNEARYPVLIGKESILPGQVWRGERGFGMIALRRYPGRLVFVEPEPEIEAEAEIEPVKAAKRRKKAGDG